MGEGRLRGGVAGRARVAREPVTKSQHPDQSSLLIGAWKLVGVEPEIDFGGDFPAFANLFAKHLNIDGAHEFEFVLNFLNFVLDVGGGLVLF